MVTAQLQTLRADAENRKKAGDKFYKMDEESIVTIREELSEDFFALAEAHLKEVRGLVERLDDGQLETQLQLEKYEQDRQQQEAEGKTTPITISDEERPTKEQPVEYKCIMDVFTLSPWTAQLRAICVNSIKGSCPKSLYKVTL